MIRQQIGLTKTFNDSIRRITVLIRGADILWPQDQPKARAAFTEAFELASALEKENDQKGRPRALILRLQVPDQRYIVIRAVARRDASWAKELTQQMLRPDSDREAAPRASVENVLIAERLLDSAIKLALTDINTSLELAAISLRYPASSSLTQFLYQLSEVNQQAADRFYVQALGVYADKPMREFLYLQAYPFGWHETLNTPIFSFYQVPANLLRNESLQRQFVQLALRRAQQMLNTVDEVDTYQRSDGAWLPGKVHLLSTLILLEPEVRRFLPDLLATVVQTREKILVSLPVETQKLLLEPGREISGERPDKTFDEQIDSAQQEADVNDRNEAITGAVLSTVSDKESLDHVIEAVDKISDSNLRNSLLEWFYFRRTLAAVKSKQFEDAENLCLKVEGHEQRAFLYVEIAKALLKRSDSQTHALEILDLATTEARKAGATIFAARTLLTTTSLYAQLDLNRSISLIAEAVNVVNRLENPDFTSDDQSLEKNVPRNPRKNHGDFLFRFYMPGLDPASAFREQAKLDFDTTLAQTNALTDKFQRALSTLSLAEVCLQQSQERPAEKSKRSKM